MNMHSLLWVPALLWSIAHPSWAASLPVSNDEARLLGIEVQSLEPQAEAVTGTVTMRVVFAPDAEWAVKSPLPGTLHRVLVQEGDRVAAGEPLAVVRSPAFVTLQRDYLKAQAALEQSAAAWQRDRKLAEVGSIPQRRLEETRQRYDAARAERAGLEGELRLAGFDQATLRQLSDEYAISPELVLTAPADSVVLERPAPLGSQLVGSELLMSLGDPGRLVLDAILAPDEAAHIAAGTRLQLRDGSTSAEVVYVSRVLDLHSQTVHVRAVPDSATGLNPGRLTQWAVLSRDAALLAPANSVVRLAGGDFVYTAVPGGFEPRKVEVRGTADGAWLVLAGLESGDRVAVRGTAVLKGMSLGMGGGDS